MNDEKFRKFLKASGAVFKRMAPGSECPADDKLVDYVYGELSPSEREEVERHKEHCERCLLEILKIEADRAGWEHVVESDPKAALALALGRDGVRQANEAMSHAESSGLQAAFSFERKNTISPLPDQSTIDRIAAAAAAEVLDNIDFHMARWKETRGREPRRGMETGLAQATNLGGDMLPVIAESVVRAWMWCTHNLAELTTGRTKSALIDHVVSFLHEGLLGLADKEIDVLGNIIAEKVSEAVNRELT